VLWGSTWRNTQRTTFETCDVGGTSAAGVRFVDDESGLTVEGTADDLHGLAWVDGDGQRNVEKW
jgi:hypothetical protein